MSLEALRLKRSIERLWIGGAFQYGDAWVKRTGNNSYKVTTAASERAFGGRHASIGRAITHVVRALTGEPIPIPCADCGRAVADEKDSYCDYCHNERCSGYRREYRDRLRQEVAS